MTAARTESATSRTLARTGPATGHRLDGDGREERTGTPDHDRTTGVAPLACSSMEANTSGAVVYSASRLRLPTPW